MSSLTSVYTKNFGQNKKSLTIKIKWIRYRGQVY